MLQDALVFYRRKDGLVTLALRVLVPEGDDWRSRAAIVARLVGELHFALYDLEGDPDGC